MTPNNLFNIILKILGILFLKHAVELIPDFFQFGSYIKDVVRNTSSQSAFDIVWLGFSLLMLVSVHVFFVYVCIFRSDYVIRKLKLTSGFDQDIIPTNISRKTILGIVVIIIGGLMLADSIPGLFRMIYKYYLAYQMTNGQAKLDTSYYVFDGTKIIIGLLLMGEQKRIVEFIERRTADKEAGV